MTEIQEQSIKRFIEGKVFNRLSKVSEWIYFWVAGGAIRDALNEEVPKDYDLWFKNQEDCDQFISRVKEVDIFQGILETKTSFTFWLENDCFQVITKYFYESPQECIKDFDFTCCQAAIDCRLNYFEEPLFKQHTQNKTLSINKANKPAAQLRRVIKFAAKGYEMDETSLLELFEMVNQCSREDLVGDFYS